MIWIGVLITVVFVVFLRGSLILFKVTAPWPVMDVMRAVVYAVLAPVCLIALLFLGLYPALLLSSYACDHIGRWPGLALTSAIFLVQVVHGCAFVVQLSRAELWLLCTVISVLLRWKLANRHADLAHRSLVRMTLCQQGCAVSTLALLMKWLLVWKYKTDTCTTNSTLFYRELFLQQMLAQANHLLVLSACGSDAYSLWLRLLGSKVRRNCYASSGIQRNYAHLSAEGATKVQTPELVGISMTA